MTYAEMLELQLRQATERLILVEPAEQPEYLKKLVDLAGQLARLKREKENKEREFVKGRG